MRGPFTIKHAKHMFPGLADGVVQHWRDKHWTSGNPVKQGLSIEIQYSLHELVHLGVINQLSILGVFQRRNPDLSVEVFIGQKFRGCYYLDVPDQLEQILDAYQILGASAVLDVEIAEVPLQNAKYRNRRAAVEYYMALGNPPPLKDEGMIVSREPGKDKISYTTARIQVGKMIEQCGKFL